MISPQASSRRWLLVGGVRPDGPQRRRDRSRQPCQAVIRGFSGDPVPDQARVISAAVGGVQIVSLYVVNGRIVGSAEYDLKLQWLNAVGAWLRRAWPAALARCQPLQ